MLKITEYAHKLECFFNDCFEESELRFVITLQLNFSIEVSLYMFDTTSLTKDKLKQEYSQWLTSPHTQGKYGWANMDVESDIAILFKEGSVSYYVNEFNDMGDPGIGGSGLKWGPRYRLSSLIQHGSTTKLEDSLPPIMTFYSYKGGMGRTTAMMGFALWLANKGKRVAIIDCDLEAPGYLNFFNLAGQRLFSDGQQNGFVEFVGDCSFMQDYAIESDGDTTSASNRVKVENYTVTPTAPKDDQKAGFIYDRIFIVPGGNLNDAFFTERGEEDNETTTEFLSRKQADNNRKDYIEGLSRINLSNPSVLRRNFKTLIQKLQKIYNVDIILIDSRTGFNDIYGSVAFDLATHVVGFFGFSKQTMPGLRQLLENYAEVNKTGDENSGLNLTICNSILPEFDDDKDNIVWHQKWQKSEKAFRAQVEKFCANHGVITPNIFPIHRNPILEELGMDNNADLAFLQMVLNGSYLDFERLFESLFNSIHFNTKNEVVEELPKPIDSTVSDDEIVYAEIRKMRPLQLTKVILRELKPKLASVKNFAEHMDSPKRENFLYRECMKDIFDFRKFIIRGFKGAGKTCIYQALGKSSDVTEFIRKRAGISGEIKYDFINVINFEGISNHPLKVLEEDGVFEGSRFYNVNALWQILTWHAIFSRAPYVNILEGSALKDFYHQLSGMVGSKLLNTINRQIKDGASEVLEAIEDDLFALNEYLAKSNTKLFILYDGLDNVVKPKYWSKAISPLINKWGGNVSAYSNIHPKIFLRTDLFERIEGTNTERLRDNIIDIDWSIDEVFGYLFKLILGERDCQSREAVWAIVRKLRGQSAESMIKNYTRAIKKGLGQFPSLDEPTLKPLVEIFFGREVKRSGRQDKDHPWDYFRRELSNAAGVLSMRPFINTLSTDVIDKALENNNPYVKEIISPEFYASQEIRTKVAEAYFNDMSSEQDFTDDLQKVRDFINSSNGKEFRKKELKEQEFSKFLKIIMEIYGSDMHAVDNTSELAQLLYASGLMKEVYKPGRKIYRFAPMFVYVWGLQGKIDDEDVPKGKIVGNDPIVGEEYIGIFHPSNEGGRITDSCDFCLFLPIKRGTDLSRFSDNEWVRFTLSEYLKDGKAKYCATNLKPIR